jgi:hypothetical protein
MSARTDNTPSAVVLKQILQILLTLPADKLSSAQDYLLFLQSQNPTLHQLNGNGVGHGAELTIPATAPLPNDKHAPDDDPMLRFAGMWQDDPNWGQFLADIASYRQAVDAQTAPDLLPLSE